MGLAPHPLPQPPDRGVPVPRQGEAARIPARWTPLTVTAATASGLISVALILALWVRHRRDTVLKRLGWSLVLLVPVIGGVVYGGLYRPPPVQPKDIRAQETPIY